MLAFVSWIKNREDQIKHYIVFHDSSVHDFIFFIRMQSGYTYGSLMQGLHLTRVSAFIYINHVPINYCYLITPSIWWNHLFIPPNLVCAGYCSQLCGSAGISFKLCVAAAP